MAIDDPPTQVLYVPQDFPTIQAALDAIATGGRVVIAPGIYTENLFVEGKRVQLVGSGGPEVTIVDGSGAEESVLHIRSGGYDMAGLVKGITFRGGSGSKLNAAASSPICGGGLMAIVSNLHIEDCFFIDNTAQEGGGIFVLGSTVSIVDCHVASNKATHAVRPGGGLSITGSIVRVERSRFIDNEAMTQKGGGGIGIESGWVFCRHVVLQGNRGRRYGAIRASGHVSLVNCTVVDNTSVDAGFGTVGVVGTSSAPEILNTVFWQNLPQVSTDLYLMAVPDPTITNSIVRGWTHSNDDLSQLNPGFRSIEDGDLDLLPHSDLIAAGSLDALNGDLYDVARRDRVVGASVDIGAYEYQGVVADPPVPPAPDPCPADLNRDGRVDAFDLLEVLVSYGMQCSGCPADLDGSGVVDGGDLLQILMYWGPCPQ